MKRTHKPFDMKAALDGNEDLAKLNPHMFKCQADALDPVYRAQLKELASLSKKDVKTPPDASKALKQAKKVGQQEKLKARFLNHWNLLGGPRLTPEYRFHHERMWRWDFCIPERMIAIEIDGGAFMKGGGGHNRGVGKGKDEEKRNTATAMGWRYFVYSETTLKPEFITVAVNCCKVGPIS